METQTDKRPRMTRAEYMKKGTDYRGEINGIPYLLYMDENGTTVYGPVDLIPEQAEPAALFTEGDIVSTYTRAQALEDGFLIDLNQWIPVNESGFKYPVACTAAVFAIIERTAKNRAKYAPKSAYSGIIWDMFHMSRVYYKELDPTTRIFKVKIGRQHQVFKITCGPGDTADPVLTILLPTED